MEIETREELFTALTEAAELEHGLLCQYLFAAASLKQTADEGISWRQAELVRDWKRTLLEIARQEMAHLGTVCNMVSAVGGAPHLSRPNFPQPARHFPADAPYALERFGAEALRRFVRFEEPEPPADAVRLVEPAPTPIEFAHVGELYRTIEAGFAALDDGSLFIGPTTAQDDNDWSRGLHLSPVHDLATVRRAIDFIVVEGEGTGAGGQNSHHQRFLMAQAALTAEHDADPTFEPARPVADNPVSRLHLDVPTTGNVVSDRFTRAVSELFSVTYESTLLLLTQFYSFGSEMPQQRNVLRQSIRELMSGVVRPLSEVLTLLPMGPDHPGLTAGAGFEIYGDVHVSPHAENAWRVVAERLQHEAVDCLSLASEVDAPTRLRLCGENLHTIGENLKRAAASGFAPHPPAPAPGPAPPPGDPVRGLAPEDSDLVHEPTRLATARYGSAASAGEQ